MQRIKKAGEEEQSSSTTVVGLQFEESQPTHIGLEDVGGGFRVKRRGLVRRNDYVGISENMVYQSVRKSTSTHISIQMWYSKDGITRPNNSQIL